MSSVHCIGCLGGGVGGDNESWATLVHTQEMDLNFQEATLESWKPIRVNSGWLGD